MFKKQPLKHRFGGIRPKRSSLYNRILIFMHIFLKITPWFCIISQINNKSMTQIGYFYPDAGDNLLCFGVL